MSFNTFRIKRQAHTLSRQDSGWSPFGHLWKLRKPSRRETWDAGHIEAQNRGPAEEADGSPIQHAATAPGLRSTPFPNHDDDRRSPSPGKEQEAPDAGPRQEEDAVTAVESQPPTAPQDGLRNRRENGKNAASDAPETGSEADSKKQNPDQPHKFFKNVQPKTPFTVGNQLQRTVLNSWINILLVAAPVGIALNYVPSVNRIAVFVVNFIAIVPLAAMLSFATEEIALRTGETLGGLLNATFGNAVELIVAVMALTQKPAKVVIVQTSLIGSILSNLLLVMGMCFFCGGLRRREQYFNTTVAQTAASLLALAVASIIVPTVFDMNTKNPSDADAASLSSGTSGITKNSSDVSVAPLSRGTSVITLIVYGAYLLFQLKTHQTVFSEESQKVPAKPFKHNLKDGAIAQGMVNPAALMGAHSLTSDPDQLRHMLLNANDEDEEEPQLHFTVAIITLTVSTVIIALCAEFMVDSIDAVTKDGGLSEEFVGLILLPIVGNAAEHATAVTVAIKDKMDLAIGVAVGSSMQVALFLIPLLVIIGWGMGLDNMTLSFDIFQVAVLFVSVLLVNYLIADGKSHWLEGFLLICLYFIIAVCAFYYPSPGPDFQA